VAAASALNATRSAQSAQAQQLPTASAQNPGILVIFGDEGAAANKTRSKAL
jgi:hypothetical protein